MMQCGFFTGPLDGLVISFRNKAVPKAIEFYLRGCGASGFRSAVYEYDPDSKAFYYIASFEEVVGEPMTADAVPTEWMRLEGSKKEGGGIWCFWQPINMGS